MVTRFFDGMLSTQRPIVVDVGANRGTHTAYPAAKGARVWAVEPYEPHAKRLALMAKINSWELNVFCGGADEVTGTHVLHHTGTNIEMRNVLREPGKRIEASWDVSVVRLDEWVRETNKITFLKVDTDGHDYRTLRGATGLFHTPGVKYAKIEFIPYSLETAHPDKPNIALEMLQFLTDQGFALYHVTLSADHLTQEYFCFKHLQELPAGEENDLVRWGNGSWGLVWCGEMRCVTVGQVEVLEELKTPEFPWAAATLFAVNRSDVGDLERDLACDGWN